MTARLRLRVHPGARGDRLRGWHGDGALKVDVAEPPEGGRANEALVRLIAAALGVGRAGVTVKSGHGARSKVVEVAGLDDEAVRRRIERALAAEDGGHDG